MAHARGRIRHNGVRNVRLSSDATVAADGQRHLQKLCVTCVSMYCRTQQVKLRKLGRTIAAAAICTDQHVRPSSQVTPGVSDTRCDQADLLLHADLRL